MSSSNNPLALITECLKREFSTRLLGVMLFGSRARGDHKDYSDYDIFVLLENLDKNDSIRAYRALRIFRDEYLRDTSLVVLSCKELYENIDSPIVLNALYEGIIIYDREGVLRKVKEKLLHEMKKLGMRRIKKEWGYIWEIERATTPFRLRIDPSDPQEEYEYRLDLSREHLDESTRALKADAYIAAIHEAQLAIENAAKAVIAIFSIPSWIHNPAPELREIAKRVQEKEIRDLIEELAEIAEIAAPYHAGSSYGNAERRLTPRQVYTRREAQILVERANRAIDIALQVTSRILSRKESE